MHLSRNILLVLLATVVAGSPTLPIAAPGDTPDRSVRVFDSAPLAAVDGATRAVPGASAPGDASLSPAPLPAGQEHHTEHSKRANGIRCYDSRAIQGGMIQTKGITFLIESLCNTMFPNDIRSFRPDERLEKFKVVSGTGGKIVVSGKFTVRRAFSMDRKGCRSVMQQIASRCKEVLFAPHLGLKMDFFAGYGIFETEEYWGRFAVHLN